MPINRTQWTHPDLQALVQLFFDDASQLGEFREIQPEALPDPYRHLLAHTSHMTVTMEQHHGCDMELRVLACQSDHRHYSRKIVLSRHNDGKIVQFGIVRLSRHAVTDDIFREIQTETRPLGRILVEHQVLRNVKLMTTWEIDPGPQLREAFENPQLPVCYGRTALIYTYGIPAVELLEIVADV